MDIDREVCYRALKTRDARFDGRFFTAVLTTGIYCRPICPAKIPKFENCLFFTTVAAAHAAGFRPCLRCRPEAAPETSAWRGTATTIARALNLIAEGVLDDDDVEQFAARLGVGGRHLRRLFDQHIGASPIAVAQTRRILFGKKLLNETLLPIADIAFAAGFGSVRRFNTAMVQTYGRPPRELRRSHAHGTKSHLAEHARTSEITLKLPFKEPYDWESLIAFFQTRAIPGVEFVEARRYQRTIQIDGIAGTITVEPVMGKNHLLASIHIPHVTTLAPVMERLRQMFDLDANIDRINEHLAKDAHLKASVASYPGLRLPGAWDPFELAIRGILGQQISVAAARTLAGRLVAKYRTPLSEVKPDEKLRFIFPTPHVLARADLTGIGITKARATTIAHFAQAIVDNPSLLSRSHQPLDVVIETLQKLPGIGPWTAQYIAMRALHEPDAFPASDLGLLQAMRASTQYRTGQSRVTPKQLEQIAEKWRPWRSYAALHLWKSL